MKCNHDDCLTCPYPECLKDNPKGNTTEAKRRYNKKHYESHKERFHEKYMKQSEGKVKRRYKTIFTKERD